MTHNFGSLKFKISTAFVLSTCPDPIQRAFFRDLCLVQEDIQRGISTGQSSPSNTHWKIWASFATSLGFDPFLEAVQNKVPIVQVFLHRVRSSTSAANRDPVRAQTTEDYLRSIDQTFLAVGKRDPRLDSQNQIDFNLRRMLKAYSKKDPPPN